MLPIILSSAIFLISLALILSDKIHRAIVALAGAVVMVTAGLIFKFYTEDQAIANIDFNTLGLLLGMMILVALLEPTGFFEFLAVYVARISGGNPVRLLVLLGAVTSLTSMFLDNVTTVVLIAPVTILICEILGVSSQPYLLSEALLSNVGGVSTLVGDPPNILIASAADFSFIDFLIKSLPIVLVCWLVSLFLLLRLFQKDLSRPLLDREALLELNPGEALKDRHTANKVVIITLLAVLGFFLEEMLHIRPAFVALSAAAAALVWVRPAFSETLKRVEWDILLFFAALFVIVGGLSASGVLGYLSRPLISLATLSPLVLGLILLWLIALLSAIVDNVPITIALIPIIQGLASAGISTEGLWWAMVFGAGFGGNGTIIGATANIVVTSLSNRTREPITPAIWSKRGLPVMLASCLTASILYVAAFYIFGW
jgi:Na+/H+ antiporter NhaD/arsenite permease-like protein